MLVSMQLLRAAQNGRVAWNVTKDWPWPSLLDVWTERGVKTEELHSCPWVLKHSWWQNEKRYETLHWLPSDPTPFSLHLLPTSTSHKMAVPQAAWISRLRTSHSHTCPGCYVNPQHWSLEWSCPPDLDPLSFFVPWIFLPTCPVGSPEMPFSESNS